MGHLKGAGSNKAQCGNQDPPSQDPRDHNERLRGMTLHPDTLKQTSITPGHNKVVRNYRRETGG